MTKVSRVQGRDRRSCQGLRLQGCRRRLRGQVRICTSAHECPSQDADTGVRLAQRRMLSTPGATAAGRCLPPPFWKMASVWAGGLPRPPPWPPPAWSSLLGVMSWLGSNHPEPADSGPDPHSTSWGPLPGLTVRLWHLCGTEPQFYHLRNGRIRPDEARL